MQYVNGTSRYVDMQPKIKLRVESWKHPGNSNNGASDITWW